MRILFVINVKPALNGITLFALNYAENMDRRTAQVDFVFIADPPEDVSKRVSAMGARSYVLSGRNKNPVAYVIKLSRAARGYDVMHVHGNSRTMAIDLLAGAFAGVKTRVAQTHNTHCKYALAHKLLKPLFEMTVTDRFACSEDAGGWVFGKKPYEVARVAISAEKFRYDAAARAKYRAELGAGDVTLLGCVANFNPAKNHAFLIDAFAEYHKIDPSAKLALAGGGAFAADARARVNKLGLDKNVLFLGRRNDVPGLLQAFDIALLPSLYEGFPTALIEMQAAGLSVFASDTITRKVNIAGQVRFLPISRGVEVWAEALATAPLGQREALSDSAIAAIRREGYDIEQNARKLADYYESRVK